MQGCEWAQVLHSEWVKWTAAQMKASVRHNQRPWIQDRHGAKFALKLSLRFVAFLPLDRKLICSLADAHNVLHGLRLRSSSLAGCCSFKGPNEG